MNDSFRERLLRLEQVTPALKERYDKEVQAMLENRITGSSRRALLRGIVMNVVIAVLLVTFSIIAPAGVPLFARIPVAVAALFSVGFVILLLRILRRGSFDVKSDTAAINGMVWVFGLLITVLFILIVPNSILGLRMIIFALVFLVIGAVFRIRHVIEQSELKTREKLLEIEYLLAELAETAKPGKPKA